MRPCVTRVNLAVTNASRARSRGELLVRPHAKLTGCRCANANCVLTAPADVQPIRRRSGLGSSGPQLPRPQVLDGGGVVLYLRVFVGVFKSALSGQERKVLDKIFKMKDLF